MTARGGCSAAGQKAVRKLRRTGKETEKAAVNVAVPLNESRSQPRVEQSVQSARSILVSAFLGPKGHCGGRKDTRMVNTLCEGICVKRDGIV